MNTLSLLQLILMVKNDIKLNKNDMNKSTRLFPERMSGFFFSENQFGLLLKVSKILVDLEYIVKYYRHNAC